MKEKTVVGFDFGTTNSLVSVVVDDRVHDLLDDDGLPVPSVVKYEGVRKVVGKDAKDALDASGLGVHGSFVKSPKTYLGDETITVEGVELSPVDITFDVIDHVRQRALLSARNDGLLADITAAVATIPVDMNGLRRRALREAYGRAGIGIVQFVHEPFAALYGHFRPRIGTDFVHRFDRKNILVVDWGGGTLDLTLCRMEDGRVVQLQNAGTAELGGDVFDDALRNWVLTHGTEGTVDINPDRRRQLRHKCEALKIHLSEEDPATLYIRNFYPETGTALSKQMTRGELESIAKPLIDRAMDHIVALLDAAHVSDSQVALCLVTGGMSRMPAIAARLREFFGPHRVEISQNSATLVAQGAAWIAYDRQQLELAKDLEVRLARGGYQRILRAGTKVPVEGEALASELLGLYCADPRDGHAKFQICAPTRPGSHVQRSDPRDDIDGFSLDVDTKARPLIERLQLRTALDPDGIVEVSAQSDLFKFRVTKALHDLQFGISLGSATATTNRTDDPGPPVTQEPPEAGSLVIRSNLADTRDDSYVPGELLYTYKPTYFSRALNPPQIQVDERLYYQPCAICHRRSNDPECRCGSR
ncbi:MULTISPECIES: Hsp70 family protein [Nocardia]|uniref:Hsp70 family protein n=1 Tax=Nocardia nova TaxID=37330 RepID=A0A2T2Z938_9NOCA|nr:MULTISPECIES: Hsp70 family protein [Nocardia]PSR64262.1 Hsp70 family protein [Nocardia nova]